MSDLNTERALSQAPAVPFVIERVSSTVPGFSLIQANRTGIDVFSTVASINSVHDSLFFVTSVLL